jgi:transposase
MGEPRRKYNEQFKCEAVELSFHSEKTIKELANDLGISHHNLARWRREYTNKGNLAFPGNGKQKLTPEQEEIQRLKNELLIVKEERDILKKQWPSSQRNKSKIPVYTGSQQRICCGEDMSNIRY